MFSYRCMHIVCSKPTLNKSIPTACCTLIFAFSLLFFFINTRKNNHEHYLVPRCPCSQVTYYINVNFIKFIYIQII